MSNYEKLDLSILYLEDDATVRESVKSILNIISKNVYSVSNGIEALEYINDEAKKVDIIVSDIRMPQMDGLEFLDILRNKLKKDIPAILTTAFNEPEYLVKAIELKVEKFAHKPLNLKELMESIRSTAQVIINQRELEKKKIQLENYTKAIQLTNFVLDIEPDGTISNISSSLKEYFEKSLKKKLLFKNINQIIPKSFLEDIFKVVNNYEVYNKDIAVKISDENFILNVTAFASYTYQNNIKNISLIIKDLTHIVKEKEEQIKYLYTDITTKLPNRHALLKELNEKHDKLALIILSIDSFSKYKHSFGREISDNILIEVANEVKNYWPDERERNVYKLEEELFAITTGKKEIFNIEKAKELTLKIIDHFDKFVIQTKEIYIDITVTLGASCQGKTDILIESLIALDIAKISKKNFVCFSELNNPKQIYTRNILMQQKIKNAMSKDNFITFFQPIVDKDKNVVKYETLVRMIDPDEKNKILTPNHFLKTVQEGKYYEKLTKTIIRKGIEGSLALKTPISINLSFEDITNPEIINYLENILKEHPYPITLEFLESEGLQDIEKTIRFCKRMKSYGADIAIDDFGSGYSNYDYFFDVPIDILKIDGSLVKRINEYKGYLLLESIVSYAKKLHLHIVAEYVEDKTIFEKLKLLDVDLYQGYYIDKPKPLSEILK